jgi:hypothetical protein
VIPFQLAAFAIYSSLGHKIVGPLQCFPNREHRTEKKVKRGKNNARDSTKKIMFEFEQKMKEESPEEEK